MTSRTIVITGASGGIGAELARQLAPQGHRLVLAARRAEALQLVVAACEEAGARAVAVATDVTRRADVERLHDVAVAEFGHYDVWVNNAGRGISRPVLELTDADMDEIWAVNVKSAVYGMQVAARHFMARERGHLINVSSFLGRIPLASIRSVYSAAKAALNSLTANLRMDLAAHPAIHVSTVMPGVVLTDFARNVIGGGTPMPGGPGTMRPGTMQPQTVEEIGAQLVRLIDAPAAELYTNPASHALAQRYYADVAAFEAAQRAPA